MRTQAHGKRCGKSLSAVLPTVGTTCRTREITASPASSTPQWGTRRGFTHNLRGQRAQCDREAQLAHADHPSSQHFTIEWPTRAQQRMAECQGPLQAGTLCDLCNEGRLTEAVEGLDLLVKEGSYIHNSIFYDVLKRCIVQKDMALGRRVHALAVKSGYESNAFLANHLICMYASHGKVEEAMQVFSKVVRPNRYVWASIILAHARHGRATRAIKLYQQMLESTVQPDDHIFVAVLKACTTAEDLSSGRGVHSDILRRAGKPDKIVYNCLIAMYAKCASLEDARKVFDTMRSRDAVTWNNMIAGYAQHDLGQEALALYASMQQVGNIMANHVTFVFLLQACASLGALHQGKQLHGQIQERGLETDIVLGTCLVDMYSKCRSLEDARRVFDKLPNRDVVSWTAMIAGYAQHGFGKEALMLHASMQQEGIICANHVTYLCLLQACASIGALHQGKQLHAQIKESGLETDLGVGNCLVDMYSKCGSLEDAQKVFDNLPIRDVVSWTAIISGYAQNGLGQKALALYASMRQECVTPPDAVTFVCLLQACGSVAGLEKGKEIHAEISKSNLDGDGSFVTIALIDMYGKCGSMADALQAFDAFPSRDIVSWNALISGYARQGESEAVFDLFHRLRQEGNQPDRVTFLSLLTACSHVGLVDKGQRYFEAMTRDYGISPGIEHYTCMVDLLGRVGQVDKAMALVKMMPYEADSIVWCSMLGACRKWHNVELGRDAFDCAVRLDSKDSAPYVLMSSIYAAAQMWDSAREIQAMKARAGARKKPGQSWWTDLDGIVHTFAMGDKDHPEWQHIDAKLQFLFTRMKMQGYVPHLDSVLRNIPDDLKEAALCGHSERIAIAYALLKTPQGTTIRVVKNLRVCEDCHRATALISKIEQRTIVCRDASRFHVFMDGKCSCGDYW